MLSLRSGYKTFFPAQLNMYFILLINVKMSTIVGYLTFITWICTVLKQEKSLYFVI